MDDHELTDEQVAWGIENRLRRDRKLPCGCKFITGSSHPLCADWVMVKTIVLCAFHKLGGTVPDMDFDPVTLSGYQRGVVGYIGIDNELVPREELARLTNEALAKRRVKPGA